MNVLRCFLCAVVVIGTASFSFSQKSAAASRTPPQAKIQALLRSGDPQSAAWGAHYVLQTRNQSLVSDLLSLAENWQPLPRQDSDGANPDEEKRKGLPADDVDRRDAMSAVLDALIQMHVSVPVETLRNLAPDFPNYVAVLLSRLPLEESSPLAFDLYRFSPPSASSLQYVSAALLAQEPPPGFADDLFSRIHVRATIFVTKPGAGEFGTGGGGHDCFQLAPAAARQGWPSLGTYEFSKTQRVGSFLVAPGVDPIYAIRSETTHYAGDSCLHMVSLGPEERRRLLAQILNISPEAIHWQTQLDESIEFKSDEQLASDLQSFITIQQEKYRATAAALVAKGLITSAEQEVSLPHLDIRLNDVRGNDYAAITPPSPLPAHVSINNPWH